MSQFIVIIPFIALVIIVLIALTLMDWFNNRKVGDNLQEVALATNGNLVKEKGIYNLNGKYCGRNFNIFMKFRGVGKRKALYYHVNLHSECDIKIVCLKRHVRSRLEAKINELIPLEVPDEDFSMVHRVLVEDEVMGNKFINNPVMVELLKSIMEKFTEMAIKKDITLLKRYHVKLTEPEILLGVLENLIKIAVEVEKLSQKKEKVC